MQYILSQEEMDEVTELRKLVRLLPTVAALQKACTEIADTLPSFKGWDGKSEAQPWGCILTAEEKDECEWYCDMCPVQKICPNQNKSWSK